MGWHPYPVVIPSRAQSQRPAGWLPKRPEQPLAGAMLVRGWTRLGGVPKTDPDGSVRGPDGSERGPAGWEGGAPSLS